MKKAMDTAAGSLACRCILVLLYQKELCYNGHKEKISGYQGTETGLKMTKLYKNMINLLKL